MYAQHPNVIFILADDIGYEIPTCDGGQSYQTPNIDALAANGMRFTQCQAAPLCSPSRFMILTGKYNFRNYSHWGIMDTSQRTIANMFENAGYKTAVYGKWQLAGGDFSIHKFGFQNYAVINPLNNPEKESRYKNPLIYTNGAFLADSVVLNKFSDDIFTDSVTNFIDSHKTEPFFIYYPMSLCHSPDGPTPDDTAFANWNPNHPSDTSFFKSMVKYMDKKIGAIVDKITALNMQNNTVIIFAGDNGTVSQIYSEFGDSVVHGGKKTTTIFGTHVPLIISWPNTIAASSTNNDLVDFTDFIPTLASVANIPKLQSGIQDGIDFSPRLTGAAGSPRDWVFCHFRPESLNNDTLTRWVQNKTYKLYDTISDANHQYKFYNIVNDNQEANPIPDELLTPQELAIKQQFIHVLDTIDNGLPSLKDLSISDITLSSAKINAQVLNNGGYAITEKGIAWDTLPFPSNISNHIVLGNGSADFHATLKNLFSNKNYYVTSYAQNNAGIAYSNDAFFVTLALPAPVADGGLNITQTSFVANWSNVSAATQYLLDVSKDSTFSRLKTYKLTEGFDNGLNLPQDWFISGTADIYTTPSKYGKASPSIRLRTYNQKLVTDTIQGFATGLSFWMRGVATDNASALVVEGFNGSAWINVDSISPLPSKGKTQSYNAVTNPVLPAGLTQFRFRFVHSQGNLAFDDVNIQSAQSFPSFIDGYNAKKIKALSQNVTGLQSNTKYYYRVRAANNYGVSANSNLMAVITCGVACKPVFAEQQLDKNIKNNLQVSVLPNPSSGAFQINFSSASSTNINVTITNMFGKIVYQNTLSPNKSFFAGQNFAAGLYILRITQGTQVQTFKLIKVNR